MEPERTMGSVLSLRGQYSTGQIWDISESQQFSVNRYTEFQFIEKYLAFLQIVGYNHHQV